MTGQVARLTRRKLHRILAKFGSAIERTSVRLADVNGPRGGIDKLCQVKIVVRRLPSVYVNERDSSVQVAMDGALARANQEVRQASQRGLKRRKRETLSY